MAALDNERNMNNGVDVAAIYGGNGLEISESLQVSFDAAYDFVLIHSVSVDLFVL